MVLAASSCVASSVHSFERCFSPRYMMCLFLGQLLAHHLKQELFRVWGGCVFIPGSSLEQGSSSEVSLFRGWDSGGIKDLTKSCS